MNYTGVCENCDKGFEVTGELEQHLYTASGLCPDCRNTAFEESYRDQDGLACCRNCRDVDQADDWIVCGHNGRPVSTIGICDRFERI